MSERMPVLKMPLPRARKGCRAMAHHNQHGGWAAQAKRRGEAYESCNQCGGRKHPRNLLQADWSEVSPGDRRSGCLQGINAMLVSVLIVLILIWAVAEVFGAR